MINKFLYKLPIRIQYLKNDLTFSQNNEPTNILFIISDAGKFKTKPNFTKLSSGVLVYLNDDNNSGKINLSAVGLKFKFKSLTELKQIILNYYKDNILFNKNYIIMKFKRKLSKLFHYNTFIKNYGFKIYISTAYNYNKLIVIQIKNIMNTHFYCNDDNNIICIRDYYINNETYSEVKILKEIVNKIKMQNIL